MRLGNVFSGGYKPLGGQSRISALLPLYSIPSTVLLAISFLFLYLLALLYCWSHLFRDPTSAFFDPVHGYDKAYSLRRESEAQAFIDSVNANMTATPRIHLQSPANPTLCLGIATIFRPNGSQYIDKTVGSLMAGLTDEERNSMHFIFFVAHTDPNVHPSYGESWTQYLPDTLLDYNRADEKQLEEIKEWEASGNHRMKGFYDYTHLLNACKETGAPYIAMLEGDVLAAPGWLSRTMWSAVEVDGAHRSPLSDKAGSIDNGSTDTRPRWLYIRMFWTETYLGWNSEEWPTYFCYSAAAWLAVTLGIMVVRIFSYGAREAITAPMLLFISGIMVPACIGLYFAAGRMTVQPPAQGVRRMDNFGCCSQGMVFRNDMVPTIITAIEDRIEGYMDMLLETLASRDQLERWAIFPSLLQHIGGTSSKGDTVADERARMIWNFAFERYGDLLEAGWDLWRTPKSHHYL